MAELQVSTPEVVSKVIPNPKPNAKNDEIKTTDDTAAALSGSPPSGKSKKRRNRSRKLGKTAVIIDGGEEVNAIRNSELGFAANELDRIVVTVINSDTKVDGESHGSGIKRIVKNLSPSNSDSHNKRTEASGGDLCLSKSVISVKERNKSTGCMPSGLETNDVCTQRSKDDLDKDLLPNVANKKRLRRGTRGGKNKNQKKNTQFGLCEPGWTFDAHNSESLEDDWNKDCTPGQKWSLYGDILEDSPNTAESSQTKKVGSYTALLMKNQGAQKVGQGQPRNHRKNNSTSSRTRNAASWSEGDEGRRATYQSKAVIDFIPTMVYKNSEFLTPQETAFVNHSNSSSAQESYSGRSPKRQASDPGARGWYYTDKQNKNEKYSKKDKKKPKNLGSVEKDTSFTKTKAKGSQTKLNSETDCGSSPLTDLQTPHSEQKNQKRLREKKSPKPQGTGEKNRDSSKTEKVIQGQQDSAKINGGTTPWIDSQTPPSAQETGSDKKSPYQKKPRKKQRKMFEDYLPVELVSMGLKRGTIIEGKIRINPKNFEDAYIPHPDGKSDVYIRSTRARNRALNGDVVAVMLNPRDEWKVFVDELEVSHDDQDVIVENEVIIDLEEDAEVKGLVASEGKSHLNSDDVGHLQETLSHLSVQSSESGDMNQLSDSTGCIDKSVSLDKQSETPEKAGKSEENTPKSTPRTPRGKRNTYTPLKSVLSGGNPVVQSLFSENNTEGDKYLQRTGKVVYIIDKVHSRATSGYLKMMQDKNPHVALFSPIDSRMPRIKIPMSECPQGFRERPDDVARTLFIARVIDWDENSNYAKGRLMKSLGQAGEIEPETEAILMSYDVDFSEFPDEAINCLPKEFPWKIPEKEFESRKDLTKSCIFTIDPATARDLDDALSCEFLENGVYEIGVHIADVSYFIDEQTALDYVARSRATSVYLVQKVIPMLPRLLCEQLCSLNPDEDRLSFSVIWKMTEDGEILNEWFGRTIIRSCVKMSYAHAQGFLDDPDKEWSSEELPPISEGFSISDIAKRVLAFNKIAKNMRKQRFDNGALRLDQVKLQFALDKETGLPNGYSIYEQKDSNRLIEEFMLLANMAVAHKIYDSYSDLAFLRRHQAPQDKMMQDLVDTCHKYGYNIDASSAGTLQRTLYENEGASDDDKAKMQILSVLCSKPMQLAKYFCSGCVDAEQYRHYALNVPLYTHFTSPIRRFADVLVHRQLAAAIGLTGVPIASKDQLQRQADVCNIKKNNAKVVQDMSSDLFFAVFIRECGPLQEVGMVMAVLDKAFDVLILKLGVVKRVYCDQLDLKDFTFSKRQKCPELTLIWKEGPQQIIKLFIKQLDLKDFTFSKRQKCPELTLIWKEGPQQIIKLFIKVNCTLTGSEKDHLKWNATIHN